VVGEAVAEEVAEVVVLHLIIKASMRCFMDHGICKLF
jgi:hypothetical protein